MCPQATLVDKKLYIINNYMIINYLNSKYILLSFRVEHPRIIIAKGHIGVGFYFSLQDVCFHNAMKKITWAL